MDWEQLKHIFLDNIKRRARGMGKNKTWVNIQLYGINEKGRSKNNLWRSDQKEFTISTIIKIAKILNISVGELLAPLNTTKSSEKPKCIYSRVSDNENKTGDILDSFSDKKLARECLESLAEIDRMSSNGLKDINYTIHTFLEGMRAQKKTGT